MVEVITEKAQRSGNSTGRRQSNNEKKTKKKAKKLEAMSIKSKKRKACKTAERRQEINSRT